MNKQELASKIWESANKMRSKIEANEYKDYILGFIFYKYLSDRQVKFLVEEDFTYDDIKSISEEDSDTLEYIQQNVGYFIGYENLFSTWIEMGRDFNVSNVRDALSAFSRLIDKNYKKVFDGIFNTLQTGLSKLGDSSGTQTKAISELLQLIKDIPTDGKQGYDVLGFIYEYLIGMFAANAGKKAGEFYTPHEVSILMSEIIADHLKDSKEIKIYDPTSGSGSLLINIGDSVAKYVDDKDNIKYFAQELKENTYNLTRMNLIMRGIKPDNIVTRNADTLEDDWPYFDDSDKENTYEPLYVDAVVSNPPYSQPWDPKDKEFDPRYARFGLAPKTKADYAFLLHDLYHLKPKGIMTIVLPHGVLFRGGEEGNIRKNLIEYNNIDAIIGLPPNVFFGTGIPTIIMVLRQERKDTDVLIVDGSKCFVKEGKNNKLRSSDIKKIVDAVTNRANIDKFSRAVSLEEIRQNEYNLNIPRYVDSSEKAESFDIYSSMFGGIPKAEIEELQGFWEAFPDLQNDLFVKSDTPYTEIAVEDIKSFINNHSDITSFIENYKTAFSDFNNYLKKEIIENMMNVNIAMEEKVISENIFSRLKNNKVIDKYHAYQLLDDEWVNISVDLEIIQSEGFSATKVVKPNMVIKKKKGKDEEVQEGWVGHIMPFELVQKTMLFEEYSALKKKEERLLEIPSLIEEVIEDMTEEEKETSVLNDGNTAFISKELDKTIKTLQKEEKTEESEMFLNKLLKASRILKEEKTLKSDIKKESATLHLKTKDVIENLTDEEIYTLLEKKWIETLVDSLFSLPYSVVSDLVSKIENLSKKYETTFSDIEKEIKETEKELSFMIDDLVGDDFDMKGLSEFKKLLLGE